MRQTFGTTDRAYAGTMAGFWSGLSRTLRALDTIAADPRRLGEASLDALRTLQYRLHRSSELLDGVEPPAGSRDAHDELRDSLIDARDATAEMVDAIEFGGSEAAGELLFEWRGALFRVRFARLRLGEQPGPEPDEPESPPNGYSAAVASGLAVLGAVTFVAGAALILWPLWAAGLALVAGAVLVHRP